MSTKLQQQQNSSEQPSVDLSGLDGAQQEALALLQKEPTEEHLWRALVCFSGYVFYTASGLPFTYSMKQDRAGDHLTGELFVDRKANSKSITRSTVMNAFHKVLKRQGEVIAGPKKIGQIFGISYLYAIFWKFGLIEVPEKIALRMQGNQ